MSCSQYMVNIGVKLVKMSCFCKKKLNLFFATSS